MFALPQLNLQYVVTFMLVLTRVSGLVASAPIYGTNDVPMQVRALLAIALAVLIMPTQLGVVVPVPDTLIDLMLILGSELLVGLTLGMGIVILMSGLQLAGQVIAQLSGTGLAETYNPSFDTDIPLVSQLLYMFALAVFVTIGGHRLVMSGLLGTFASMPPGSALLSPTIAETMVNLATQSFTLAIRAAAPATVALLLTTVVLGLISRTLPQLNILSFGFALNALATLATLWVSLGTIAWVFQEQLDPALESLLAGLHFTE
jgi:flagellar biosynthetic protein FliR